MQHSNRDENLADINTDTDADGGDNIDDDADGDDNVNDDDDDENLKSFFEAFSGRAWTEQKFSLETRQDENSNEQLFFVPDVIASCNKNSNLTIYASTDRPAMCCDKVI